MLQTSDIMKLLLAVTLLLVAFELAPSALTDPVFIEEEAEAVLQAIQTIVASAENVVHENQAATTATPSTDEPPSTRPEDVFCTEYPNFKGCYSCYKKHDQPVVTCWLGTMNTTWDHPAEHN